MKEEGCGGEKGGWDDWREVARASFQSHISDLYDPSCVHTRILHVHVRLYTVSQRHVKEFGKNFSDPQENGAG
jgi:hypothetical protein